jgi:uncharacterized protein with von Willebrand factor type A (vWA) domain
MFKSIDELMQSPLAERMKAITDVDVTDRVLKSTRLEQRIYNELRGELSEMEAQGSVKLHSFKSLMNDVFQSFYSINPRYNAEERLTAAARKLNKPILADIMGGEEYRAIKPLCEGREFPAIEAAGEFIAALLPRLDELLDAASGKKESLDVLEKVEKQRDDLLDKLAGLLEQARDSQTDPRLAEKILQTANRAESKSGQADTLGKMVDRNLRKNADAVSQIVQGAIDAAAERAELVTVALTAWGNDDGTCVKTPVNTELLEKVKSSKTLTDITKYLGRYREMLSQLRKNSFAFGRGEKYDVEYGNSISRALTSELSLLATPELVPLFLRKYQNRQLKQYRRREQIYKGGGDVIVCLDESGSTTGDPAAWGKAVALTMLEICNVNKRNFALVHFSTQIQTDVFRPGDADYNSHMLLAAETFLGGGTSFTKPLEEAVSLIENDSFTNADVVFVTDGACAITDEFTAWLREKQLALNFNITGILLDGGGQLDFSLREFCDTVYRTSELSADTITANLITNIL